jgi:hypothetical protein
LKRLRHFTKPPLFKEAQWLQATSAPPITMGMATVADRSVWKDRCNCAQTGWAAGDRRDLEVDGAEPVSVMLTDFTSKSVRRLHEQVGMQDWQGDQAGIG